MLDKQDLQAIKELIDTSIAASEQRLTGRIDEAITASEQRTDAKLTAMEQRIKKDVAHETMVMMEQYFQPKFQLLAENQQLILEKLDGKVDKEDCQNSMSVVAAAIRTHSRDIEELKA